MTRRFAAVIWLGLVMSLTMQGPVAAADAAAPLGLDCIEAPTPDMPGQGLSSFFDRPPAELPPAEDPFARGSTTTIYEQYGFSGLRWHTYDLGCGPDVASSPDAVIGTAVSNWITNLPVALAAMTSSVTRVAFNPTFLDVFDPAITRVSEALHERLFASWIPAVIALLGILILLMARRAALATTAAAVGWAIIVILVATALFRWPLAAGHFADDTVTTTLGSVVSGLGGNDQALDPGVAVASHMQESLFYQAWLAGTLGSTDSATARRYGPELFKAQALSWSEAAIVQADPERGKQLIEAKQDRWAELADEIKESDPAAYEHLTGRRSDTRVGFAVLTTAGALLGLSFLLASTFVLLGSFLIVRFAVMLFPAFAILGALPSGRGLVIGLGRTVGAALVNAVVFGVAAAISIRLLVVLLDPTSLLPRWLGLVLLALSGFLLWMLLKPFRRLAQLVGPRDGRPDEGERPGRGRANDRSAVRQRVDSTERTGTPPRDAASPGRSDPATLSVPDRAEARPWLSGPDSPLGDDGEAERRPHLRLAIIEGYPRPETHPDLPSPTEPAMIDDDRVFAVYRPDDRATDGAA